MTSRDDIKFLMDINNVEALNKEIKYNKQKGYILSQNNIVNYIKDLDLPKDHQYYNQITTR